MGLGIAVGPEQLQGALQAFLSRYTTTAERVGAVEAALESVAGRAWRAELGKWATWLVPVEELVPEAYRDWRPLVRDAMQFVVTRLSASRLAPKVVELLELPPSMGSEQRLLRLITKVPGLQKIGQVLARNRRLDPRFRRALSELENSISDVGIAEIRAVILRELGPSIETCGVRIQPTIFSEASVSAVVRFTWRNPETGRREPGVFKVLKPHIPGCFSEDMKILERLAGYLARKYLRDRSRFTGLAKTLAEIRLLLAHEVDFRREQATLPEAANVYRSVRGVRVPRLIPLLSTDAITALTYENGVKVTDAFRKKGVSRTRLAGRLAETLIAIPVFARKPDTVFHADPHAGNVLYDKQRGDLVILDWALAERLSSKQRRHVTLFVLMTALRDPDGVCRAIENLRHHRAADDEGQARTARTVIDNFLNALPLWHLPSSMDAMNLLDEIASAGVRFPASLAMFRKAVFTLDGVLEDIAGTEVQIDSVLKRYAARHWASTGVTLWSLLTPADWIALDWSALTFSSRLCGQALFRSQLWLRQIAEPQTIAAEPTSG